MALNPAEFLADLDPQEPPGTDPASQADDHMRSTKKAIKQTFPGLFNAPLEKDPDELEDIALRIAALEGTGLPGPMSSPRAGFVVNLIGSVGIKSVTGLGFQPRVVLVQANYDERSVAPGQASSCIGFGASDGTLTRCVVAGGIGAIERSEFLQDTFYRVKDFNTDSVVAEADFVSLDADGFTYDVTNAAVQHQFIWWAFG